MFNHLKVPESWNSYFSKYPQGLTIMEALLDWVGQVDVMVDDLNNINLKLDEFYNTFETKLDQTVKEFIENWAKNDEFKNYLMGVYGEQLDVLDSKISTKRDKSTLLTQSDISTSSESHKLTMNHLSQEVKNAMSGTTPVSPNIEDGQVTSEKIADGAVTINKANSDGVIDYTLDGVFVADKFINGSGIIYESAGWKYIEFDVSGGKKIYTSLNGVTETTMNAHAYSTDGAVISKITPIDFNASYLSNNYGRIFELTTPDGCKKIRLNVKTSSHTEEVFISNEPFVQKKGIETIFKHELTASAVKYGTLDIRHFKDVEYSGLNLFKYGEIIQGYISTAGNFNPVAGFVCARIEVDAETEYTLRFSKEKFSDNLGSVLFESHGRKINSITMGSLPIKDDAFLGQTCLITTPPLSTHVVINLKFQHGPAGAWDERDSAILQKGNVIESPCIKSIDGLPFVQSSEFGGKKWQVIGDSLTEFNARATKNYHDYVAEELGLQVINSGLSGSGYRRKWETNQAFYHRAGVVTTADITTIFGSFNDLNEADNFPIGEVSDRTNTTIAGCVNLTIARFFEVNPKGKLAIILPTPWNNKAYLDGGRALQYCQTLEEIAKRNDIPVLDLWRNSGLRVNDVDFRKNFYSKDDGNGIHPDENGHKFFAPLIREFIKGLI